MKNFGFYIFASILVLVAASCRKDTTRLIPTETITIIESDTTWDNDLASKSNFSITALPPFNIEKLINQLSASPKFDTCNAESGGTIVVPNNVTVTFPKSACVTSQNKPCTGKLDVEILVLRKKGDFISYNLPTTSANKQLISGGVVSIKVRQNGQEVKLGQNKTIKVRYLMTEPDAQMQLFEGRVERFNFDWILIPATGQPSSRPFVTTWQDSTRRTGYDMTLDRFGLINCGRFSGDSTNFNNKFTVSLPETFTNVNTSVYVAFKDLNSVLALSGDSKSKAFVANGRGLPVGRAVTVVVMGFVKEKFYFAKREMTIPNTTGSIPSSIRLTPTTIDKEDLKETLKDL